MKRDCQLVSIIVRTKDRPELLLQALRSISAQTYRPVEAVVVNDGGCDLDAGEMRTILGDVSLNYIRLEKNRGRAHAGNAGIEASRGEYIGFLDDDDRHYPDHLEVLVPFLEHSGTGIVYSDAAVVHGSSEENGRSTSGETPSVFSSYDFSYNDLLVDNYIPLICLLFRADVLKASGGFDESFDLYEDWDLLLRLGKQYQFCHTAHVTAQYNLWSSAEQIANVEGKDDIRRKAYDQIFSKHRASFTPDVILNLKQKRESIENSYRELIDGYRKLEDETRAVISRLNESEEKVSRQGRAIHDLTVRNSELTARADMLDFENVSLRREIQAMADTLGWRFLTKVRETRERLLPPGTRRSRLYQRAVGSIKKRGIKGTVTRALKEVKPVRYFDVKQYHAWIKEHEPGEAGLRDQHEKSLNFRYRPLISIIVPVYNTDREMLVKMIESVMIQSYGNWELCIADGNSVRQEVKKALNSCADRDKRIKVKYLQENKHISGNSNEALSIAEGEFVGFLDHDDELAPFALYEVVRSLNSDPGADFIYSDEDKIDPGGERNMPFFKPSWSPDLLLSVNYLCHFSVVRRSLLEKTGGFRSEYDGAQDYDLFLRVSRLTNRIVHVPKILYHWRTHERSTSGDVSKKGYADAAGKAALTDFLKSSGVDAYVLSGRGRTNYRVRYRLTGEPLVSIIVPFKDKSELLKTCVESIVRKSSYKRLEVILVSNRSTEAETIRYLDSLKGNDTVKIITYDHEFNFSAINNFAVTESAGEYLIFLNNDTEVITPDWIEALLEHAQRTEVGAVGCKLLFPDKTIQHAGVVLGMTGFAGHVFAGLPDHSHNYFGSTDFVRNYLAVTAACMMVKRSLFESAGGFNEQFILCGSDVELCLRMHGMGFRTIYTPHAVLYHHESVSRRGCPIPVNDFRRSLEVYGKFLENGDPYYSPNLTLLKTDCALVTGKEEHILKETVEHALG